MIAFKSSPSFLLFRKFSPFLLCLIVLGLGMALPLTAKSQQRISVVALVNGEPITSLDLENRMKFIRELSRLDINESDFRTDTLQKLVTEQIKYQTAKKQLGAYVNDAFEPARTLIDQTFSRQEKPGRQVLKEMGIPISTVTDKYVADILWGNVLRTRFPRQFENLDNLAQQELEKLERAQNEPQIKLSEILLQPNPQRPIGKTIELAEKIVEALKQKANFGSIATQYSEAATAAQGGRVDWLLVSKLPEKVQAELTAAKDGAVIGPVEIEGRIYVLRKDGYREFGLADPKAATLTLARAVAPLGADATKQERAQAGQMLSERAEKLTSCQEIETLNTELGSQAVSVLNNLQISALSPQLQKIILPLQVGDKSPALPFSEGMTLFMVCDRIQPKAELPDIETLKQAELQKLFTSISGRYLLRLQRKAVIDYRDGAN